MSSPALSGWCLARQHPRCAYSPCACECHGGNQAGSDRSTIDSGRPGAATPSLPNPLHIRHTSGKEGLA